MPHTHIHLFGHEITTWLLLGKIPALLLFIFLIWGGIKSGWNWRVTLLSTAVFATGLSLGVAFLPSIIGAFAGAVFLWWLSIRFLHQKQAPWAYLALGMLTFIAVGRFGCLLNGCCFGTPSSLPWAMQYEPGSAAFVLHSALEMIEADATHSMSVHPYPIYDSLGLLIWILASFKILPKFKSQTAYFWSSMAFVFLLRGFIDGYRGQINVWWSKLIAVGPLDGFQIALLIACIIAMTLAWKIEKNTRNHLEPLPLPKLTQDQFILRSWGLYGFILATAWTTQAAQTPFLTQIQTIVIFAIIPSLQLPNLSSILKRFKTPLQLQSPFPRWVAPLLAIAIYLPILLTPIYAQSVNTQESSTSEIQEESNSDDSKTQWNYAINPNDSTLVRLGNSNSPQSEIQNKAEKINIPKYWIGLGGNIASGSVKVEDGCGGGYSIYNHSQQQGWLSFEYLQNLSPETRVWYGTRIGAGSERINYSKHSYDYPENDRSETYRNTHYNFSQWIHLEGTWWKIGGGALLDFRSTSRSDSPKSNKIMVLPVFSSRIGASGFGLETNIADRQSIFYNPGAEIGFGGRLFKGEKIFKNERLKYFIGFGTTPAVSYDDMYIQPNFRLNFTTQSQLNWGFQVGVGKLTSVGILLRFGLEDF